jgi:hypothetical protein
MELRLSGWDGRDTDGTEHRGVERRDGGNGGSQAVHELTLFEFGYRGRRLADIARATASPAPGIVVVDVRYAVPREGPKSSRWFTSALQGRYRHIRALGNVNFRGGPIRLLDADAGIAALLDLNRAHPGRLALMCACEGYEHCHRRSIVEAIRARGIDVVVAPLPSPPPAAEQGGLF